MQPIMLQRGRTRATVVPESGGRLAQLEIQPDRVWLPLFWEPAAPPEQRDPLAWGCYAMLPWPNRIADGRFWFDGTEVHGMAGANHLANGNAIHGLGFMQPWTVEAQRRDSCSLSLDLDGLWPFAGRAVQTLTLLDDGIEMTVELHSIGRRFPGGAGWHPWFRRNVLPEAAPRVQVDADQLYVLRPDQIPTGEWAPDDASRDLRSFPEIGDRRLDDCYANVISPIRIAWADVMLSIESSSNVRHAVVYTPAHAFCVEPQTCAIDAFNLQARGAGGSGVIIVEPGNPPLAWTRWRWTSGNNREP